MITPQLRARLVAQARADAARNPSTFERSLAGGSRAIRHRIRVARVVAVVATVVLATLGGAFLGVAPALGLGGRPHGAATSPPTRATAGATVTTGAGLGGAGLTSATTSATQGPPDGLVTTPPVVLESLTVGPAAVTVTTGDGLALTATATFSDGTTTDVTRHAVWSRHDHGVLGRVRSGRATAIGPGSTTVSATWRGRTGTSTVTVREKAQSGTGVKQRSVLTKVVVAPAVTSVCKGPSDVQLSAAGVRSDSPVLVPLHTVTWTSSDPSRATVEGTGLVHVLGTDYGTVTVVATSEDVSGSATLTVKAC